jgi:hypothetical protein
MNSVPPFQIKIRIMDNAQKIDQCISTSAGHGSRAVFAYSEAGIVGSHPTQTMDV